MNHTTEPILTTEQRNRWFEELTPKQKRIQIALDVLKHLRSGYLQASKGVFAHVGDSCQFGDRWDPDRNTQEFLQDQQQCQVCGIGALLVTRTLEYNEVQINHNPKRNEVHQGLQGIFSESQLALIENAFEKDVEVNAYAPQDICTAAAKMYRGSTNSKTRLAAIMRNIIRNGGTFVVRGFTAQQCS